VQAVDGLNSLLSALGAAVGQHPQRLDTREGQASVVGSDGNVVVRRR
jgi:hypothetical protein